MINVNNKYTSIINNTELKNRKIFKTERYVSFYNLYFHSKNESICGIIIIKKNILKKCKLWR